MTIINGVIYTRIVCKNKLRLDKPMKLNDNDREQWIANDESLYNWWRGSRQSMRQFIRENRAELDKHIHAALDKKPIS
jgi:hypothetical protein